MNRSHFPFDRSRRQALKMAAGIGLAATLLGFSAAAQTPLLTRTIPRSGEALPVIGLGTAIVFDVADTADNVARRDERRGVMQTLLAGGGSVIDTAPSYGAAEDLLGDLLTTMTVRPKVFLATKVRTAERAQSIAEMQQSQRRLRSNRLDLMQLHNVGTSAKETAAQVALLNEWKEQGICRYVGITHYLDYANERLIDVMQREKIDFVQVNYSIAERAVEQRLLQVARDTGTAVLINLPFARGKVFQAVRGKALPAWAGDFDAASWGQFFLKYLLAQEAVSCVIPGTDKPEYMLDNLAAGRGRLPDAAQRRKMLAFFEAA